MYLQELAVLSFSSFFQLNRPELSCFFPFHFNFNSAVYPGILVLATVLLKNTTMWRDREKKRKIFQYVGSKKGVSF
jgi:hypothetical protein